MREQVRRRLAFLERQHLARARAAESHVSSKALEVLSADQLRVLLDLVERHEEHPSRDDYSDEELAMIKEIAEALSRAGLSLEAA